MQGDQAGDQQRATDAALPKVNVFVVARGKDLEWRRSWYLYYDDVEYRDWYWVFYHL